MSPLFPAAEGDRYPALEIVTALLKGLAVLSVMIGALLLISGIGGGQLVFGVIGLVIGGLAAVMTWALAEIIDVLVDIESNTRDARDRLSKLAGAQRT